MIMLHKNATRHDANAPDEIDGGPLPQELIQMVIDLRCRLGEQRAKADRKRELVAIHRNTAKCERKAVTQLNH